MLNILFMMLFLNQTLDAFETVYGERALVDYDFYKASLIVSVELTFLEINKVEDMIQVMLKEEFLKQENVSVIFN